MRVLNCLCYFVAFSRGFTYSRYFIGGNFVYFRPPFQATISLNYDLNNELNGVNAFVFTIFFVVSRPLLLDCKVFKPFIKNDL